MNPQYPSAASPSVPPNGSKVLVSGASGFLAAWIITDLLDQGFEVIGTVRSPDKGDYLVDLFKKKSQKFTYTIVKDIGVTGVFDEAVKGVSGIVHVASPFHHNAEDPESIIRPAVDGTVSILESALKFAPDLKRVVVTGSTVSITHPEPLPYTYTETDWNDDSVRLVENLGSQTTNDHKYNTSKVLAERAAWSFVEKHKPSWGLAVINPPLIYGPILHQVASIDQLNTSATFIASVWKGKITAQMLPYPLINWIDVRDVSAAHLKALTIPEASGHRFVISQGPTCFQDLTDFFNTHHPEIRGIPVGKAGAAKEANDPKTARVCSSEKAKKMLGLELTSFEKSVQDTLDSFIARGW